MVLNISQTKQTPTYCDCKELNRTWVIFKDPVTESYSTSPPKSPITISQRKHNTTMCR